MNALTHRAAAQGVENMLSLSTESNVANGGLQRRAGKSGAQLEEEKGRRMRVIMRKNKTVGKKTKKSEGTLSVCIGGEEQLLR